MASLIELGIQADSLDKPVTLAPAGAQGLIEQNGWVFSHYATDLELPKAGDEYFIFPPRSDEPNNVALGYNMRLGTVDAFAIFEGSFFIWPLQQPLQPVAEAVSG